MSKHLMMTAACALALAACVTKPASESSVETLPQNVSVDIDRNVAKGTELQSWWTLVDGDVLDKFVSAALDLNSPYAPDLSQMTTESPISDWVKMYQDPNVNLVHDVAKTYVDYRSVQHQISMFDWYDQVLAQLNGKDNLLIECAKTGDPLAATPEQLIKDEKQQKRERHYALLESERHKIQQDLVSKTKLLPGYVEEVLKGDAQIPDADIKPLVVSSARIFNLSQDVRGAYAYLKAQVQDLDSVNLPDEPQIFPDIPMDEFFGISGSIYSAKGRWKVKAGSAVQNINLIELKNSLAHSPGATVAFETFKDYVFSYITDIEKSLVSFMHLQDQYHVLTKAALEKAKKAKEDRELIKQEGKFFDGKKILSSQDEAYKAVLTKADAQFRQMQDLLKIYKDLGVY